MINRNKIIASLALVVILIIAFIAYQNYLTEKGRAWKVFQNYITASRDHNRETMQELSYKLSDVCAADFESQECIDRMNTVYNIASEFERADFEVWSDDKQIVLVTPWREEDTGKTILRMRQIIYFLKEGGSIKLLAFKPWQGTFMVKNVENPRPIEELQNKLIEYTDDTDNDGIDDYLEGCRSSSQNETCVQTDPTVRDTDGDGYWDGLEPFL